MKINKLQGLLLVIAGIVLLSAMCFGVVFANFAITDKVANADEATASADAVPFVVGSTYTDIYFDFNADNSSIDSELSTYIGGAPFEFLNLDSAVSIMGIANYNDNAYSLALSSNFFQGFIWTSNDGWLIDSNFTFDDLYICSVSVPLSFISAEPFESEPEPPEPPVTYDDNLTGISVGDSALCIIPDLDFVGNEFYQDDVQTDFTIAEFSISGSSYHAYISVIDAGVAYKYRFGIYVNSWNPTYRVDLYWATAQIFGYYINSTNIPLVYEGLADEFYEMSDDAQAECYRFLNSLNFISDAPSVELYQDLMNRYDSLNEQYQNLVDTTQYVNVINDGINYISPAVYGTMRSDRIFTSISDGITAIYANPFSLEGLTGTILSFDLNNNFVAGTKFRFGYRLLGTMVASGDSLGWSHNGSIGYINSNGVLTEIFTTDATNYYVNSGVLTVEFTVPEDVNTLYLYSNGFIAVAGVQLSYLGNASQTLIDQAYQRGVDSVNVNDITKRAEEAGYYRGLSEQNPYTFRSLMGAVVDAPLDVFTQMFDFDILGVNMKGLYLSLFTLALVILVIKFALARG